jgi:hypothetical protein
MKRTFYSDDKSGAEAKAMLVGRRIVDVKLENHSLNDWYDLALVLDDGSMVRLESTGYEADGIRGTAQIFKD